MTRRAARGGLLCALLGAAACGLGTEPVDPEACQQTYEFGNYGCARIVVMVQGPPQPWPAAPRWEVRAVTAREGAGFHEAYAPRPDTGVVPLHLIRRDRGFSPLTDTVSVWVSARMRKDPQPMQTGVPLPVVAADSVLHVARFALVGERPPVDTVWLTLRRP